ncbi:hypothetical protein [Pseudomonas citrulli]|uniref:Uncharacterized protein n=1 Tax=Pseudomonas citrulli TaxID=3064347 RepID=A0ABT9BTD6_9PSED|nr:hypothetical protein [Pseudomonas sp. K18]MDO7895436.1 hypothetical protein [Pseudomonas sp. K18]
MNTEKIRAAVLAQQKGCIFTLSSDSLGAVKIPNVTGDANRFGDLPLGKNVNFGSVDVPNRLILD